MQSRGALRRPHPSATPEPSFARRTAESLPRACRKGGCPYALLFVFDIHVLGVNHAFVFLLALAVAAGGSVWPVDGACAVRSRGRAGSCLRCFVHLLRQLMRRRG